MNAEAKISTDGSTSANEKGGVDIRIDTKKFHKHFYPCISLSVLVRLRLSMQKVMVVQQSILPNDRRTELRVSL